MEELLITLRVHIGDVTSTRYSDIDLKRLLCVAANYVTKEVDLNYIYTINVAVPSISPIPDDTAFINLTSLKAAIILLESELRDMARKSISITDGPSKMEFTNVFKNSESLLKSLYEQYGAVKLNHGMNGENNTRHVVSTPTTVENYHGENFR